MNKIALKLIFFLLAFLLTQTGEAKIKLPVLVSDGMVLQRDQDMTIWGDADAGEEVHIFFLNRKYVTVADTAGNWQVIIPPQRAGGPYRMVINELEISNILIGDVWLGSGQSNMELPVSRVMDLYREEAESYTNPMIRYLKVPLSYNFHHPLDDIKPAAWKELTAEHVPSFGALAYFFAREMFEQTKVPVGVINASVGGSPAEAWISEEGLKLFPAHLNDRDIYRSDSHVSNIQSLDRERRNLWNSVLFRKDTGLNENIPWFAPDYNDAHWEEADLFDKKWASDGLNPVNGTHWFRKEFTLTGKQEGAPAVLRMGCIVDADSVFINGVFIGTTAYQYPPRIYRIPANLLKKGANNITVRLISYSGNPGFVEDKPYKIVFGKGEKEISLEGTWSHRLGTRMPALAGETFFQYKPTGLFNAMIHPLKNWGLKGVIWYQGESNTGRYNEYYDLMTALVCEWRSLWERHDLPFLMVQLPNFMLDPPYPAESNWAEMREIQLQLSKTIPQTGLAVTIDIGEWNDIHPLNKKEVGKRLALQAERIAYGNQHIVSDGPLFHTMRADGNRLIIHFKEGTDNLLPVGKLKGFSLQGADGRVEWAEARIEENRVIVWNDQIAAPVKVRYAWGNNPEGANLRNREGLPASPFEASLSATEANDAVAGGRKSTGR